jgi:hypothetical protein
VIAVIAVTGVDATNKTEREHLSNDLMKNANKRRTPAPNPAGSTEASSAMKAKQPKSPLTAMREPDDAEKRAIGAAKQAIAEMEPRFDVGTRIKTENGAIQILQGPSHSDIDGWHAQFMAAFGTASQTVAHVEVERIAKALRQRDGTIDPAELDTVIAIVSGQQPKNELEAMTICQMAVTHALMMRSFGKLNRSNEIQQQDSNALTVARLTKAFASQVDALAKLRRGGEQWVVVEHVHVHAGAQAIVGAVTHTGGPRALIENPGQPHATNVTAPIVASNGETMRSQNAERETVPISNGERPQALPNARRGIRIRGTKR